MANFSSSNFASKLENSEFQSKIDNIRKIVLYSEHPGVLCLFEFSYLCGLPSKVSSREEENYWLIRKDVAEKRILFYNNKNFEANTKYSFIKYKDWSNLDYLLAYGSIIEHYYNDHHKIYINMENKDLQANLVARKDQLQSFVTKEIYTRFQKILNCKSCNPFLSLNLKAEDFENLRKLYSILYPISRLESNFGMLTMLLDNLYQNLQIKIDIEKKNKLKNFNTDMAIFKLIIELKNEMRKLNEEDSSLIKAYDNRLKVINYVRHSRNVLYSFSDLVIEDSKKAFYDQIKTIRKNYI